MGLWEYTVDLLRRYQDVTGELNLGQSLLLAVILICLVGIFLSLLGALLPGSNRQFSFGKDRTGNLQGFKGRLEKLEKTLNDLKTERSRAQEFYSIEFEYIRNAFDDMRGLLAKNPGIVKARKAAEESPPEEISVDHPTTLIRPEEFGVQPKPIEAAGSASNGLESRLSKTREGFLGKIAGLFSSKPVIDEEVLEELEETLVTSDVGVATATDLVEKMRERVESGEEIDQDGLLSALKEEVITILTTGSAEGGAMLPSRRDDGPTVVMVVGVNGVGKTTSIAKLAFSWKRAGKKVLMVAGDTFRAAAVEQLSKWGSEMGVEVVKGPEDCKPSTVVYDAMERSKEGDFDVVLIDTAGRLHTKSNLMQELEGVRNVIEKHQPGAPHETILVLDGSTGQNALSQAKEFNESVPLSGLIVTKLDGTPKGGIVIAIKKELGVPVRYIGVGESKDDLKPFAASEFADALF